MEDAEGRYKARGTDLPCPLWVHLNGFTNLKAADSVTGVSLEAPLCRLKNH
jgi:hypothetical protein